jgi:hydrogenase expression/formation protein HypD
MNNIIDLIKKNVMQAGRRLKFMEVCGTHTTAIHRNGFPSIFQEEIEFLSGPGCPVCVTNSSFIDRLVAIANTHTVYSFGDMLRVPGNHSSLAEARATGSDVRIMVSPLEAARKAYESGKPSVIAAVGFDTTAPVFALAIDFCVNAKVSNVKFLTELKTLAEPLHFLLRSTPSFDGLILPGHVAAVIGVKGFDFLPNYNIPSVITGFDGKDILQALHILTNSVLTNDLHVYNQYQRVVRQEGNQRAQNLVNHYYEPCDTYFRGIGLLPGAGLKLRPEFAFWEYNEHVELTGSMETPTGCRCGDVLLGRIKPYDCPLFKVVCRPDQPRGACMVSTEGSCAAYFRYGGGLPI